MGLPDRQRLPIGYWLKRADELLTARIDEAQRENGLTRLDWQALNVVRDAVAEADGDADGAEPSLVAEALAPFAPAATVTGALDSLRERGLVAEADGRVRLSASGAETYDRALTSQKAVREGAFAGIERGDYETTVAVLRRLVENLEGGGAAEPAAVGRPGT